MRTRDSLLNKLKKVYVDVGPSLLMPSYDLQPDLKEEIFAIGDKSTNRYRKDIIENYSKENEVVRESLEGRLNFCDVGKPIIQKAEEIYQDIEGSKRGYKFKRDEILKSPKCLSSVEQLEGIINVGNYFKNGRIPNKVLKKYADGLLSDNILPAISTTKYWNRY